MLKAAFGRFHKFVLTRMQNLPALGNGAVALKREPGTSQKESPGCSSEKKSRMELDIGEGILPKTEESLEEAKVKTRKVAMMLSFSGAGYHGMLRQKPDEVKNPDGKYKTIEEDLFSAMLKSGAIDQIQYDEIYKCKFQRASRTDKGVSAVKQVISMRVKMLPNLPQLFNEYLPAQIRCMAVKRATKAFDAKHACCGRTYAYMMPSFALAPPDSLTTESYRISKEVLEEVNGVLQLFVGTHNFHNFTSGKKHFERSARRYMVSLVCTDPYICDGLEFVTIRIKGQSFMLHQIRKMVALVIAISRGFATRSIIEKSYKAEKLDLPIGPSLGLMLEEVHYDAYNNRYGSDGMHEPLTWEECEEEVKKHKDKFIYPQIILTEKNEKSMFNWLQTLPIHSFDTRNGVAGSTLGKAYLNCKDPMEEDKESSESKETLSTSREDESEQSVDVIEEKASATSTVQI